MNPTFRHIDFSSCGPGITRLDRLTLRVWAKSEGRQQWRQLIELSLALSALHYLGKSVRLVEQVANPSWTDRRISFTIYGTRCHKTPSYSTSAMAFTPRSRH